MMHLSLHSLIWFQKEQAHNPTDIIWKTFSLLFPSFLAMKSFHIRFYQSDKLCANATDNKNGYDHNETQMLKFTSNFCFSVSI